MCYVLNFNSSYGWYKIGIGKFQGNPAIINRVIVGQNCPSRPRTIKTTKYTKQSVDLSVSHLFHFPSFII